MANLSKIKIGAETYDLKDAAAREILATLKSAAYEVADTDIANGTGVAKTAAIKQYVDSAVAVGIVIEVVQTLPTASASTMGKIYMIAQSGGKTGDYYNEYITVRSGEEGSYTYAFELIGDTRVDLSNYYTKTEADNKFAEKTALGDLAYVDSASGSTTLATADSAAFTNGAVSASATYTPAGNVAITPATDTVKVATTTGSVTAGTAPTFTEGTFTPNTPTAIDTTKFSGGSKAADTFTAGTLPSKAADTFSAGSVTTIDTTKFSGGSLANPTKSTFATAGITATVGTGTDAETLIFGDASTAQAVTEQGSYTPASLDTGFYNEGTAPSFTEGAFNAGSLPSFTEGAYTPAAIQSGFYTPGTAASKTNDTFNAGAVTEVTLPTFDNATVLTGATAAFTGTEATISSTGTATGNIQLTKTEKTIEVTVTPDE